MSVAGYLVTCSSCPLQEPCRIPAKSFMDCLESNNGVDCFHCSVSSACFGGIMLSVIHLEELWSG